METEELPKDHAYLAPILEDAKKRFERGDEDPVLFTYLQGARDPLVARVSAVVRGHDWNDPRTRGAFFETVRMIGQVMKVESIAFVSDVYMREEKDGVEVSKREALLIASVTRSRGKVLLHQFYRRTPKGIVWEEAHVFDTRKDGVASGRMLDMLPELPVN